MQSAPAITAPNLRRFALFLGLSLLACALLALGLTAMARADNDYIYGSPVYQDCSQQLQAAAQPHTLLGQINDLCFHAVRHAPYATSEYKDYSQFGFYHLDDAGAAYLENLLNPSANASLNPPLPGCGRWGCFWGRY